MSLLLQAVLIVVGLGEHFKSLNNLFAYLLDAGLLVGFDAGQQVLDVIYFLIELAL